MRYAAFAAAMAVLFSTGLAMAGTKVQGNIVSASNGTDPTVSPKSKFKLDGKGNFQVKLKGVTDALGNLAAITTGTTPDTQYFAIFKGDAVGVGWALDVPFNLTKEGQAKVKGSAASLLNLVPVGSQVGVLGVEVHEPVPAEPDITACTDLLAGTGPSMIPGVHLDVLGPNPCASGALLGVSGIQVSP